MDILLILLRLIHIVAAVAWVGLGGAMAFYIGPAAGAAGESGFRFLKSLFSNTSFARIIPAVAGTTMLAGILLYVFANSTSHFSSTGNLVLGIGALAGIVAGIHGGAVTGRATTAFAQGLIQHVPDGTQPISTDSVPVLRDLAMNVASHSRVSFVLMAIALLGMASARYL
jgi:hypothetical protein